MLKILQTCKGNAFWFLFAFQSRWLVFVKFAKQKQHYCFILFFKIPFFFFRRPFALPWLWSNVSPLNTVAAGKSQQTPGSQVHIQGSKRLCESPSGVVPSAALMSAGVNTCWELVPDRHLNVTFKESIREWEEKCDFLSFEAANLWPSVVIKTPNVSLRLLHPMSVFCCSSSSHGSFLVFSVFLLAAALCYARLIMPVYFQMDVWLFFLCLWDHGNFLFVFVAFELLNLRYYGQRACYVN